MRSIGEVLESPDIEANEGKLAVTSVQGRFGFENVSFGYPDAPRPALSDFSLDVKAGECLAVVGRIGLGQVDADEFDHWFSPPYFRANSGSWYRYQHYRLPHLPPAPGCVVPQQTVLFSGSVRENISYGLTDVTDAKLN